MLIDIVSDTICPWCFIGKRRLERALADRPELDVQIGWRPFQLNPDMPVEGMDRQSYLAAKFGGEARAKRAYSPVIEAVEREGLGIDFDRIRRTPNTLASHRLIRWAASSGHQHRVVEGLFHRYFVQGDDIGDHEVLVEVATEAGMDAGLVARHLAEGRDIELVKSEDRMAREMGIRGVPCFVFDRRYALSGAQDPEVILNVIDLAAREALEKAAQPA
ncbi:DsbA family oxidoreductase [Desertibaculum subflavum]|uniref:DsbA family oxidoreductase n=1 Tax=Desertibaculum subflavum TaxID=2268458 RepID=UPI000E66994F